MLEVLSDSLISVKTVDMQQIDGGLGEIGQRFVESAPEECREGAVALVMKALQVEIHLFAVRSCLIVAFPGIHCVAARIQPVVRPRFAKGRIGHAGMGAEFNERMRLAGSDDPVGKRDVAVPGTECSGTARTPE